jgi:hypothetical protein
MYILREEELNAKLDKGNNRRMEKRP